MIYVTEYKNLSFKLLYGVNRSRQEVEHKLRSVQADLCFLDANANFKVELGNVVLYTANIFEHIQNWKDTSFWQIMPQGFDNCGKRETKENQKKAK